MAFPKDFARNHPHKIYSRETSTSVGNFYFPTVLFPPFNTMSIPKTLVTEREGESICSSKKRKTISPSTSSPSSSPTPSSTLSPEEPIASSTPGPMEPAKKLVRWSTELPSGLSSVRSVQTTAPESASSSLDIKKLVDKTQQLEETKRPSRSVGDLSANELREVMERMEHKIHKIARKELALLNQSKKLREARNIMTNRHQRLAQVLQQALREKDPSATVGAPRLPPVLSNGSSGSPALIDLTE
jgi:hypothetical protein